MFKQFLTFVISIVVAATVLPGCFVTEIKTPTYSNAERYQQLESKTVALAMQTEEGTHVFCSGVWVAADVILTAEHCVEALRPDDDVDGKWTPVGKDVLYGIHDDLMTKDGAFVEAPKLRSSKVMAIDPDHDLALLRTGKRTPEHLIARTAMDKPRVGDRAMAVGHTVGFLWSYTTGDVTQLRVMKKPTEDGDGKDVKLVQSNVTTNRGNSGGGLFNDRGELIGICSFMSTRAPLINFFIHMDHVDDLLKESKVTW